MKFILHAPIDVFPLGSREIATALEKSGAYGAFISEHPAPSAEWLRSDPAGHDNLDPFAGLAFMAAITSRLKVVSSAIILPFRNPFITAKAGATLQILSDNRFIMGIGLGYQKEEFDALGVPFSERGPLTDEALETIKLIWKGGSIVRQSKYFNAPGNEPRPVPASPPPIWVGGGTDKALERAAKWGDGWMPYFTRPTTHSEVERSSISSVRQFSEKVRRLKEARETLGKTTPFDISVGPSIKPTAANTAEANKIVEIVQELEACGATSIWSTLPAQSQSAYLESVAWFQEHVISVVAR